MKWARYFLCYLRGAVVRLLERCSRVGSECYLRVAAKSTSLNLHEKAVQTKIFLNSKLSWLKEVIANLLVLVGVLSLSWGCSRSALVSYFQPVFRQSSGYLSVTPTEKAERNCCSASSVTPQAKTPSRYLWDTSPIWGKQPFVASSVFISGHRLTDDK